MAKSPKKPRRGGEHDPAVNTAAGAPSKGVSVDPAVNTAADAPSMGVSVDPGTDLYRVFGVCVATAPLYILKSSLAPDLLLDTGCFA